MQGVHATDATLISIRNYFHIDRIWSYVTSIFKIIQKIKYDNTSWLGQHGWYGD